MSDYVVSARKYRPETFESLIGQDNIAKTLKNSILRGQLAHAYLFCGPRGVGKTSTARIFAKTINCAHPGPDLEPCGECESCISFKEGRSYCIHELDAASNNGVDDIKNLMDQVQIPPQTGRYSVYIIDEVHMLSAAAFNAFLKTLEEPPAHAVFILATTEKHKILPTILSRCQIYDFNRISVNDMVEHLESVASKEHIDAEPEALTVIAQKADGGMRDALSIFDQVASFTNGHITYRSVIENLNVLDYEYYFKLTDFILENKVPECLLTFNDVLQKGFDGNHFITGLASHFRDLLVSHDPSTLPLLEAGASIRERYLAQAQKCTAPFLFKAMKLCNDCDLNYRVSKNKRLLIELTLIQLAQLTEPDAESEGRSPTQTLKPLFNQARPVQASQPAAQTSVASEPQPAYQPPQAAPAPPVHPNPMQKIDTGKKIPVMKAGSMNISIKRPHAAQTNTNATQTNVKAPTTDEQAYEDYIINEKDLNVYWNEFAANLPKEEAANAARMRNIRPRLLEDGVTFEAVVDNDMVQKDMQNLRTSIETHLRGRLHNRKITMKVRVSEQGEHVRAYSHLERFQMMSKKNPDLLKLKEELGLELA